MQYPNIIAVLNNQRERVFESVSTISDTLLGLYEKLVPHFVFRRGSAVTFHEASRGYAARFLGDHMASRSGGSALIRFGT